MKKSNQRWLLFFGDRMYHMYIIESESTGKYYIGSTGDLDNRIHQHNHPENSKRKTTSKFSGPWNLVYSEKFETRSEAVIRERQIKSWKSRRSIEELIGRVPACRGSIL